VLSQAALCVRIDRFPPGHSCSDGTRYAESIMEGRIEARANPELLAWAREAAGFSAAAAADRLKVLVDRLEAWEGGDWSPAGPDAGASTDRTSSSNASRASSLEFHLRVLMKRW